MPPTLPAEINKLLRRQLLVQGTNVPSYRMLDILATKEGDVAEIISRFGDVKEPAMRKAFHEMAELLRALEKQYLGAPTAAPKPVKSGLVQDVEAIKAVEEIKVFSDGACSGNPGPSGIGFVISDGQGKPLYEHREAIGQGTNNEAEYRALIAAMAQALALGKRKARFFCDSELVVNQVLGRWKIKKRELALLCGQATAMRHQFERFSIAAVPREQNKRADYLASSSIRNQEEPAEGGGSAEPDAGA